MQDRRWIRWVGAIAAGVALSILAANAERIVPDRKSEIDILLYLGVIVFPVFMLVFLTAFGKFWLSFIIGLWALFVAVGFSIQESLSPQSIALVIAVGTVCATPVLNLACKSGSKKEQGTWPQEKDA